jgi:beta-lactamase superfamily II metal-dependent hydrolase
MIKSFAVGVGDMFYINHNSDNFSIIDCFLNEENTDIILKQVGPLSRSKGITRFISTHPDEDHIRGLEALDDEITIINFYVVKNNATKEEETESFKKYRELHDDPKKAFYINKRCERRWMNRSDEERKTSGISILWPDRNNEHFKEALAEAEAGGSPNNISAIIKYSLEEGASVIWFGDMHREFMEKIENDFDTSPVDIAFAPHHGRRTGRIPPSVLKKLSPKIVILGEAAVDDLDHYSGYNQIPQNVVGDIILECVTNKVHIFTSKPCTARFLDDEKRTLEGAYYLGTLNL